MQSKRRRYQARKSNIVFCALLSALILSGCSNSNDSNNNAGNQPSVLTSCADTDSCASNPTLEIGTSRPAQVYIPSDYTTSTRYPLVIVLHGFGANGVVQSAYLGITERVDAKQYVLVTPDGTQNPSGVQFWNATPACCARAAAGSNQALAQEYSQIDDVAYIRSLIEEAAATYSIDVSRISLIGHSNGGFMALRMACEASDLVTSVVSLAGSTFAEDSSCTPATYPVNVLTLHGDMDDTILYGGAQILQAGYPGAKETIARFAAHAGCDANNPVMGPRLDVLVDGNDAETNVTHYTDCPNGVDVELWTMEGAPHIPFPWVDSATDSIVDWMIDHRRL